MVISFLGCEKAIIAQRLAAKPLGHFRHVVPILAGTYKSKLSVFSLSRG
jgi:hypothetical protein